MIKAILSTIKLGCGNQLQLLVGDRRGYELQLLTVADELLETYFFRSEEEARRYMERIINNEVETYADHPSVCDRWEGILKEDYDRDETDS